MKVLILGAGRVGESVAESLVSERNDITVIDTDPQRLREIQDRLDLRTVVGNGIQPSVLRDAGVEDTDLFIACAPLDETNLVACKVAHDVFNVPTTIARVRSAEFEEGQPLLERKSGFAVDKVICPEQSVTAYVHKLIQYPEALQVLEFAHGLVSLIAVRAVAGGPLVRHSLAEIPQFVPAAPMRVVAIYRQNQAITELDGTTRIEAGDEVFVLAATEDIRAVLGALRKMDQPVKRVMIAGGGKVGLRLAREIEGDCQLKIIEPIKARAEYLTTQLPDTLVLQGDSTDEDLLADENVQDMDLFIALTSDDEDNIMGCLLAKRMGARRVIGVINRAAYADLVQGTAIDIAISPSHTVIGELLAYVRRGDVEAVHSLRRGAAEAMEAIVRGDAKSSKMVGRRVEELPLPKGAQIGAIVRGLHLPDGSAAENAKPHVLIAHHDTVIQAHDHVIVFVPNKRMVQQVEKLFQVAATFF